MNINDVNGNRNTRLVTAELVAEDSVESPPTINLHSHPT
jgi:hypothetical protein